MQINKDKLFEDFMRLNENDPDACLAIANLISSDHSEDALNVATTRLVELGQHKRSDHPM
jgi:hypothetical protein